MKHNSLIKTLLILIILIDFMGIATVVVLFPHIFLEQSYGFIEVDISRQTRLLLLGVCLALYPSGQFFGATFFGKLSDKYGRKKILLITLLGTTLGFLLSGIALEISSLLLLMLSRLFAGICSGNVSIAQAALIDISNSKQTKARNITYGQMAMGSAYIVGPILGSILADKNVISWFTFSTPFWAFSALLGLILFFTWLLFNETLNKFNAEINIHVLDCAFQLSKVFFTSNALRVGLMVWMIFVCGWWLFEAYMPAFLLEQFMYNTSQIGYVLSFNGALYTIFQYTVVKKLTAKISSANMFKLGAIGAGVGIILVGVVHSNVGLYISMAVFVMSMGFAIPGIITCISSGASAEEQGMAMGFVNSIQAISTVIVMLLGGAIDALNAHATVIIGGAIIILSGIIFMHKSTALKIS